MDWSTLRASITLDWLHAWRDLAQMTVGPYEGEALTRMLAVLDRCEQRYRARDPVGFLQAVEQVKALVNPAWSRPSSARPIGSPAATSAKPTAAAIPAAGLTLWDVATDDSSPLK